MSDSILNQIKAEALKAKRESAKAQLKKLYTEWNDARVVIDGIEQKIVEVVKSVGETPEDIKSLLED